MLEDIIVKANGPDPKACSVNIGGVEIPVRGFTYTWNIDEIPQLIIRTLSLGEVELIGGADAVAKVQKLATQEEGTLTIEVKLKEFLKAYVADEIERQIRDAAQGVMRKTLEEVLADIRRQMRASS
jgi:hypothetical protein